MGRNFKPLINEEGVHGGFHVTPNATMSLEGRPYPERLSKSQIETPDNGHLTIRAMLDGAKTPGIETPKAKPPGFEG